MLHDTRTSRLIGLKFMDVDEKVLLSCGLIDFNSVRNDKFNNVFAFTMKEGERLIGVRSFGDHLNRAWHYNF